MAASRSICLQQFPLGIPRLTRNNLSWTNFPAFHRLKCLIHGAVEYGVPSNPQPGLKVLKLSMIFLDWLLNMRKRKRNSCSILEKSERFRLLLLALE